jgi:hypothetical protein
MLNLWLMLLVVAVGLMVLVWVGSLFFQGYIYTEPSRGLHWQAPAAGAILGLFFAWWCFAVAHSPNARPEDIPYDTIFRFSPRVEMVKKPVRELWAVKKNDQKVLYKVFLVPQAGSPPAVIYRDSAERPWNSNGVKAIELEHDGKKYRFEEIKVTSGAYPQFTSEDGWSMKVYESGPTGVPERFQTSRFLANFFFNGMHAVLWFLCLWLLVRFQWPHALGIGLGMWLLFTLALLPMMLGYAAQIAQSRPSGPVTWFFLQHSLV